MNETTLFSDHEVLVTASRVKVGNDTFSLSGITAVKLEVAVDKGKPEYAFWLAALGIGVVCAFFGWPIVLIPSVLSVIADVVKRFMRHGWKVARIILSGPSRRFICHEILLGDSKIDIQGRGKDPNDPIHASAIRMYDSQLERAQKIADAIGLGIGSQVPSMALKHEVPG